MTREVGEEEKLVGIARLERQASEADANAAAALLGRRVVHRNAGGRIRGLVEEVRIRIDGRHRVVVRVDATGRDMEYDAENLSLEGSGAPPP